MLGGAERVSWCWWSGGGEVKYWYLRAWGLRCLACGIALVPTSEESELYHTGGI